MEPDLAVTKSDDSDSYIRNDVVIDNVPQGHRIINIDTLNTNNLVCAFCHSTVSLTEVSRHGLTSTLDIPLQQQEV